MLSFFRFLAINSSKENFSVKFKYKSKLKLKINDKIQIIGSPHPKRSSRTTTSETLAKTPTDPLTEKSNITERPIR